MSSDVRIRQPPIEAALGTPVQIREENNVTIVNLWTAEGWRELKRIPPHNWEPMDSMTRQSRLIPTFP